MKRAMRQSGKSWPLVLVSITCLCVAAFASYYIVSNRNPKSTLPPPARPNVNVNRVPASPVTRSVTVYLPMNSKAGPYLAPQTRNTAVKGGILDAAIGALIETSSKEKLNLIPDGTRLFAPITIADDVATVDFSREFQDNFDGGSIEEALTLNAIAHTLAACQNNDKLKIRILVEGKPIDSLGGHFELDTPIEPDSTLLKPVKNK